MRRLPRPPEGTAGALTATRRLHEPVLRTRLGLADSPVSRDELRVATTAAPGAVSRFPVSAVARARDERRAVRFWTGHGPGDYRALRLLRERDAAGPTDGLAGPCAVAPVRAQSLFWPARQPAPASAVGPRAEQSMRVGFGAARDVRGSPDTGEHSRLCRAGTGRARHTTINAGAARAMPQSTEDLLGRRQGRRRTEPALRRAWALRDRLADNIHVVREQFERTKASHGPPEPRVCDSRRPANCGALISTRAK